MDETIQRLTQQMITDLRHNDLPIDVGNMVPWLQARYYRSRNELGSQYWLPGSKIMEMIAVNQMIDTLLIPPDHI